MDYLHTPNLKPMSQALAAQQNIDKQNDHVETITYELTAA